MLRCFTNHTLRWFTNHTLRWFTNHTLRWTSFRIIFLLSLTHFFSGFFLFGLFCSEALAQSTNFSRAETLEAIGDNTIMSCTPLYNQKKKACRGSISYLQNPITAKLKNGKILKPKTARKVLSKIEKRAKRLQKNAQRQNDTIFADFYRGIRLNAKESKRDLSICKKYSAESCNGNTPLSSEACAITADPENAPKRYRGLSLRIVNGSICDASENSPVILIRRFNNPLCTGVLIKGNTIITAAHCLDRISCTGLTAESVGGSSQEVQNCESHPDWQSGKNGSNTEVNDLAVLTLQTPLSDTPLASVCLTNDYIAGERVVLSGYGRNESNDTNLRATFNILDRKTTESLSTIYRPGDQNEGTTCNGDSGGPIFFFREGKYCLAGALSNGTARNCALPGQENFDRSNWSNISSISNLRFLNSLGVL